MPSTYEKIAAYTLPSATPSYTFSSIPATYTDLVLIVTAPNSSALVNMVMRFNGISTSVYSRTRLLGDGSGSGTSDRRSGDSYLYWGLTNTSQNNTIMQIMNYSNTTTYKTTLTRNNTTEYLSAEVGLMRDTAAINSILMQAEYNNFVAGSTFTLYGIKAA